MLFTCVAPHTKSKVLSIGGPLTSNLYFLHVQRRIQKQGAPDWWFLNHLTYDFYMRNAAYKK
jgi:hypothetical protein